MEASQWLVAAHGTMLELTNDILHLVELATVLVALLMAYILLCAASSFYAAARDNHGAR